MDHPGEDSQYIVLGADVALRRETWLHNLEFVFTVLVVTESLGAAEFTHIKYKK